jgi:hypothetical protein
MLNVLGESPAHCSDTNFQGVPAADYVRLPVESAVNVSSELAWKKVGGCCELPGQNDAPQGESPGPAGAGYY